MNKSKVQVVTKDQTNCTFYTKCKNKKTAFIDIQGGFLTLFKNLLKIKLINSIDYSNKNVSSKDIILNNYTKIN